MRRLHKLVLRRSILALAVLSLPLLRAQNPAQPAPATQTPDAPKATTGATPAGSSPNLIQLRLMIDRGHSADALKELDPLSARQPVPAGVNKLRGLALYSQNQFVEADAAFASALKQDPHDEESAQLRGLTLFRLGRPADAIPLLWAGLPMQFRCSNRPMTGHRKPESIRVTCWLSATSTPATMTTHAGLSPPNMAFLQTRRLHIFWLRECCSAGNTSR